MVDACNWIKIYTKITLKQTICVFCPTTQKFNACFVKLFEKYAKIMQFRNLLMKFFQNFRSVPPEEILPTPIRHCLLLVKRLSHKLPNYFPKKAIRLHSNHKSLLRSVARGNAGNVPRPSDIEKCRQMSFPNNISSTNLSKEVNFPFEFSSKLSQFSQKFHNNMFFVQTFLKVRASRLSFA